MKGHCLCGRIAISCTDHNEVGVCHCTMCRRWGGGPFFSIESKAIEVEGEKEIAHYRSSEWAERGFCLHCGTHLYYRLQAGGFYALSAGLFQDTAGLRINTQIFIDKKPDYYALANETPTMTEAQVMEMFKNWDAS